jgi:hypothetical protein
MIILLKLLLAHLLGDFLFQPDSWVKAKEIRKHMAYQLYLHVCVHFVLIMLLIWNATFWKWALLLSLSHLITDFIKLFAQKETTKRKFFFVDQLAHFAFIYVIWALSMKIPFTFPRLENEYILLLIIIIYTLTQPTYALIKSAISKWSPENNLESLYSAGKYIGILERLFVFTFIITNNWEGIGFLLAAKSVFRFGNLNESKDRKLTEYVMIGTLLSIGMAMLAGIIFQKLMI